MSYSVDPRAVVEDGTEIGEGTRVWHFAHVRAGARIGPGCTIGKGVYVDAGVRIGRNVKIQNNVSVYRGVEIGDGVFVGPHVCFTNDRFPRAVLPDMSPASATDWTVVPTGRGRGIDRGQRDDRGGGHVRSLVDGRRRVGRHSNRSAVWSRGRESCAAPRRRGADGRGRREGLRGGHISGARIAPSASRSNPAGCRPRGPRPHEGPPDHRQLQPGNRDRRAPRSRRQVRADRGRRGRG